MLLQSRLKSLEKKIHTNNKKLKYEPGYWTWNPCLYEVLIKSKGAHFLIKYKKILAKSPGRHVIFQVLQVTSHDDSPGKRTLYKNLLLTYSPFSGIQSVGLQHQLPVGLIARLVGHWLGSLVQLCSSQKCFSGFEKENCVFCKIYRHLPIWKTGVNAGFQLLTPDESEVIVLHRVNIFKRRQKIHSPNWRKTFPAAKKSRNVNRLFLHEWPTFLSNDLFPWFKLENT